MATSREQATREMVTGLIKHFESCLNAFDQNPPFNKQGQLEYHRATIQRRLQLGSVSAALRDKEFLEDLYNTLLAWGIGARGSDLAPFDEFAKELLQRERDIVSFEELKLDDKDLGTESTAVRLWKLIDSLKIVNNKAKLVAGSKTLHHLLPDLVVPMDRAYTRDFFDWPESKFQENQADFFEMAFKHLVRIAREVAPSQYVGARWRTSRTKVIDNAIVGLKSYTRMLLLTYDPIPITN